MFETAYIVTELNCVWGEREEKEEEKKLPEKILTSLIYSVCLKNTVPFPINDLMFIMDRLRIHDLLRQL